MYKTHNGECAVREFLLNLAGRSPHIPPISPGIKGSGLNMRSMLHREGVSDNDLPHRAPLSQKSLQRLSAKNMSIILRHKRSNAESGVKLHECEK